MNHLLEFGGRLHPLILHAPIGIFIGLVTLELVTLMQRGHKPVPAPKVLVWLGCFTAVVSAATGLLLSREDGYGGDELELHRWGGIVAAVLSLAMAAFRMGGPRQVRIGYHTFLALFGASLVVTGHVGASITHGDGFLTAPFRAGDLSRDVPEDPNVDESYGPIARIFEAKCVSCHGSAKRKGGLSLQSLSSMMEGGDSGPAVVMGDPEHSDLLLRLRLPRDDEDHMPPAKKPQLTDAEIAAIAEWINGEPMAREQPESAPAPEAAPKVAPPAPVRTATEEELRPLRAAHVHASSMSAEDGRLWVDFSTAVPAMKGEEIGAMLRPLAPYVAHLSLARCELPPEFGALLGTMKELERLDLRGTSADDSLLLSLGSMERLRDLVLVQTRTTDAGFGALGRIGSLRRVYVWGTGVTAEGITQLRGTLPEVAVNAGEIVQAAPLETEPTLKFSGDAPLPAQPVAAAALVASNEKCPVTGSAVDPRYLVVYEGKVIGFCCPNCPKQFWADPQKYLAAGEAKGPNGAVPAAK